MAPSSPYSTLKKQHFSTSYTVAFILNVSVNRSFICCHISTEKITLFFFRRTRQSLLGNCHPNVVLICRGHTRHPNCASFFMWYYSWKLWDAVVWYSYSISNITNAMSSGIISFRSSTIVCEYFTWIVLKLIRRFSNGGNSKIYNPGIKYWLALNLHLRIIYYITIRLFYISNKTRTATYLYR